MTQRLSVDDLTDEQLDALYDQLDATYRERAHLVAHLAALHPSHIGHTDPAAPDWAVVTIETPAGQMTWHIAERDMDLFAHVQPTNRICRGWDGHTTDEKYQRMRDLTEATPSLLRLEVVAGQQAEHIKQLTARTEKAERAVDHLADRYRGAEAVVERLRTRLAGEAEDRQQAEADLARVRAELHALNSETRLNPVAMAGRRDAVARIRAALDEPYTGVRPDGKP
jgi:hypothetical protein